MADPEPNAETDVVRIWVEAIKAGGAKLEQARANHLRNLSEADSARILDALQFDSQVTFSEDPDSLGLAEQQRLFMKHPEHPVHRRTGPAHRTLGTDAGTFSV